jgi:lipopolysaccharide export LptBFGC system permease protein LptF
LALLLPSTISITLPVSALLAALLTFGRFSETNEITAIRASGLTAWSYLKTPYWTGLLLVLFLLPFNSLWAPLAQTHFRQLFLEVLGRNPLVRIEENTFVEIGDYYFFVRKKTKRSLMHGISIYKNTLNGPPLRIYADDGVATIEKDRGVTFTLQHGHLEKIDPRNPDHWVHTAFDTYVLGIPVANGTKTAEKALEEMDYFQLKNRIKELKAQNIPVPDFICQIHLRWALAITPFLFIALGIPLAIRVQRGGRSIGFAISLAVIGVYYVLLVGGTGLGQRGVWPPVPAVWLANIVLVITAVFFTRRFLKQ